MKLQLNEKKTVVQGSKDMEDNISREIMLYDKELVRFYFDIPNKFTYHCLHKTITSLEESDICLIRNTNIDLLSGAISSCLNTLECTSYNHLPSI